MKVYQGKAVWEVILTANDKKQELESITLYVTKSTYEPVYIHQQRGQKTRNEITVTNIRPDWIMRIMFSLSTGRHTPLRK